MAMLSLLTDITGSNRLESEDPRWTQLFHSKQILNMRGDEDLLASFVNRLIENNLSTGNLIMLLGQTSSRIRQILERRGQPTSQNIEQCCISMHLLGLLFNIMFSRLSTVDVMLQLRLSSSWQTPIGREVSTVTGEQKRTTATGDAAMRQLIADVLEVFSIPEPPAWMHDVLFCSANLLLVLFSTQLYHERVRDENSDIFLSYVYAISEADMRRASPGSPGEPLIAEGTAPAKLIKSVLHHACALQAGPHGSVVREIFRAEESGQDKNDEGKGGFFSQIIHKLFRGGDGAGEAGAGASPGANLSSVKESTDSIAVRTLRQASPYPLLDKCVHILLILLHNRRDCDRRNPFREAFCLLCDEASFDDGVDESSSQRKPLVSGQQFSPEHMINVNFGSLADFLVKTLPSESSAHVLYALLTIHPTFTDYLVTTGQAQPVLCAVLKGLYNSSCAACVDHLYVIVIDVLIMVQHSALRQSLSSLEASAPWYSEHALNRVTLADLAMLCALRCTLYALFKAKDTYLLSNCFAIMIDLAPFLRNVGSYVSERMVKVILQLARRTGAEGSANPSSVESSPLMHSGSDQSDVVAVAGNSQETLAVLLRVCSLALSPARLSTNVHLLYALLHEQEKLKEALCQSAESGQRRARGSSTEEACDSLELLTVAEVYLSKLRLNKDAFVSAADAVTTLRQLIDAEMQFIDFEVEKHVLSFSYSEVGNADDFFVPCIWASLIRSSPDKGFALRKVVLFNPSDKNI
jgi:hypothetical protein